MLKKILITGAFIDFLNFLSNLQKFLSLTRTRLSQFPICFQGKSYKLSEELAISSRFYFQCFAAFVHELVRNQPLYLFLNFDSLHLIDNNLKFTQELHEKQPFTAFLVYPRQPHQRMLLFCLSQYLFPFFTFFLFFLHVIPLLRIYRFLHPFKLYIACLFSFLFS